MRLIALLALTFCLPAMALAQSRGEVIVTGVEPDDMLKMRRGPGTGYQVMLGLPEGTALNNKGCERVGGTPWCEVTLPRAPRLRGYVSGHYLTER